MGNGGRAVEVQVFLPEAKVIHLLCDILAENGGRWDLPDGVNRCSVLKKTEKADSLRFICIHGSPQSL